MFVWQRYCEALRFHQNVTLRRWIWRIPSNSSRKTCSQHTVQESRWSLSQLNIIEHPTLSCLVIESASETRLHISTWLHYMSIYGWFSRKNVEVWKLTHWCWFPLEDVLFFPPGILEYQNKRLHCTNVRSVGIHSWRSKLPQQMVKSPPRPVPKPLWVLTCHGRTSSLMKNVKWHIFFRILHVWRSSWGVVPAM